MDIDNSETIRPYRDNEVASKLKSFFNNKQLIPFIKSLLGKSLSGKELTLQILEEEFKNVDTVEKFQQAVIEPYVEKLIEKTTEEVTLSGLENIVKGRGYLFISNHRLIEMDAAFLNDFLHMNGYETAYMLIGDNLLSMDLVEQFFRLNKGIIVKRGLSMKERYKGGVVLSNYIDEQMQEGHSIWMSQMEGRAKDGNDITNPALIKMLSISHRKNSTEFSNYIKNLHIVPVAISYEYNPCDCLIARELYETSENGSYQKDKGEDEKSMLTGLAGFKGRVHISFGETVKGNFQNSKDVAAAIDKQIMSNYKLWESNYIAYELNKNPIPEGIIISNKKRKEFTDRLLKIPEEHQPYLIDMYTNPVINQLKLKA